MGYAESDPDVQAKLAAFREGIQKLGWAEDRNIRMDTRWPIPGDKSRCNDWRRNSSRYSLILFFPHHTHDGGAAATNAHHSYHFRDCYRSGRQRLRRELSAARRQRHWFHQY